MTMKLLFTFAAVVAATKNEALEPGLYTLKCMQGPGKGKSLGFRSSNRGVLFEVATTSGGVGVFSGTAAGVFTTASIAGAAGVAACVAVAASVTFGGVIAAVAVTIPILKLLKSDALVLSSSRRLQFDLQPSDKAPNGFTLKTRVSRCNDHGGNFISPSTARIQKNRMKLQPEEAATFVATKEPRGNLFLQLADAETPKCIDEAS